MAFRRQKYVPNISKFKTLMIHVFQTFTPKKWMNKYTRYCWLLSLISLMLTTILFVDSSEFKKQFQIYNLQTPQFNSYCQKLLNDISFTRLFLAVHVEIINANVLIPVCEASRIKILILIALCKKKKQGEIYIYIFLNLNQPKKKLWYLKSLPRCFRNYQYFPC